MRRHAEYLRQGDFGLRFGMAFFTRIDAAKNIRRFWLSVVTPTMFGSWSVLREWGRIGSPGRVQLRTFDSEEEAQRAEQQGIKKRQRHGYHETQDVGAQWSEVIAAGGSIQSAKKRSLIKSKKSDYSKNPKQGVLDFSDTSGNFT